MLFLLTAIQAVIEQMSLESIPQFPSSSTPNASHTHLIIFGIVFTALALFFSKGVNALWTATDGGIFFAIILSIAFSTSIPDESTD
jgi:uncharacterized membrane protein